MSQHPESPAVQTNDGASARRAGRKGASAGSFLRPDLLTREVCVSAGHTAADAQMRKAGRTKWNRDDYNLAGYVQAKWSLGLGGNEATFARAFLKDFHGEDA